MTSKTIKVGELSVDVTEPVPIQPVYADTIIECRLINGIAEISLGASIIDGQNPPEARVVSRLRVPLGLIQIIGSNLSTLVTAQQPPAGAVN